MSAIQSSFPSLAGDDFASTRSAAASTASTVSATALNERILGLCGMSPSEQLARIALILLQNFSSPSECVPVAKRSLQEAGGWGIFPRVFVIASCSICIYIYIYIYMYINRYIKDLYVCMICMYVCMHDVYNVYDMYVFMYVYVCVDY